MSIIVKKPIKKISTKQRLLLRLNINLSLISVIKFICFMITVIVTEKTNILLRYLHQQWEKKVH